MTTISKDEFLRACNQKIRNDQSSAEEEARLQEEARLREQERLREEAEARARARENAQWDSWYQSLPQSCKNGFILNDMQYSVNPSSRTITKVPLLGDPIGRDDREGLIRDLRFSGSNVNAELGI